MAHSPAIQRDVHFDRVQRKIIELHAHLSDLDIQCKPDAAPLKHGQTRRISGGRDLDKVEATQSQWDAAEAQIARGNRILARLEKLNI